MSGSDSVFKSDIEGILSGDSVGQGLITYFEGIPPAHSRRALSVLSGIYPGKTVIPNDELSFIIYMLSQNRWTEQESFPLFVSALGIIDFTDSQRKALLPVVKSRLELLCTRCTFELDHFLMILFGPQGLIHYLESLVNRCSPAVLEHILNILRYEDFSDSAVSEYDMDKLSHAASQKIKELSK